MSDASVATAPRHHLAVDMGAESSRVIAGTFTGTRLELEEIRRFPSRNVEVRGTRYWDILSFFGEIRQAMSDYAARFGSELGGIGVDTWGVDFGLIGRNGQLLGNPVHYRDHRTDGVAELLGETMPHAEIYGHTGIQFMPFNTLNQLYAVRKNAPELLREAETLLFMPDLLHYFLTGVRRGEYTIASTSQLLDVHHKTWSKSIFEAFGLPVDIMPELIEPGTVIAPLDPALAQEVGLGTVPVIAPCGHDTASAVAAVPAEGENWAFLSSGTWSLMGMELHEAIATESARANNFTNEGGIGGTIRFLKNIMGLWILQRCRADWARRGEEYDYAELAAQARSAEPFKTLIDVDDPRFFNPDDMLAALSEHCSANGQPVPESVGATVRAVLEGLALRYAVTLDRLEATTGRKVDRLHAVGGGIQNELLCQMTADAIGRPVVAGPVEATAMGNIMVQLMATGKLRDLAEGRRMVAASTPVKTYEPTNAAAWRPVVEAFRKTC